MKRISLCEGFVLLALALSGSAALLASSHSEEPQQGTTRPVAEAKAKTILVSLSCGPSEWSGRWKLTLRNWEGKQAVLTFAPQAGFTISPRSRGSAACLAEVDRLRATTQFPAVACGCFAGAGTGRFYLNCTRVNLEGGLQPLAQGGPFGRGSVGSAECEREADRLRHSLDP